METKSNYIARRFALLCVAGALLFVSGCASSRGVLPSARIQAELMPDGSLAVVEEVVYALGTQVRSITHAVEGPTFEDIAGIAVDARMEDGSVVSFARHAGGSLGGGATLVVDRADETHALIALYYLFPDQGDITISYRYTLKNMARRYTDAGTFTWDVLGSKGWNVEISQWSLQIYVPIRMEDRLDVALPHMPQGTEYARNANGLRLNATSVRPGARAQIRVDFSPAILPYTAYQPPPSLAERRAQQTNDARNAATLGLGWLTLCLMAALGGGAWFYRRVDRDPRVLPKTIRYGPALGITAPAELSALMPLSGGAGPRDLAAMLLHLIHRNHLALISPPQGLPLTRSTMDQVRITRRPAPRDTLLDGEFFLIHWFIDTLGDGTEVTLEQIRRTSKERFRSDYRVWRRLVNEQVAQRPWFENLHPYKELLAALGGVMLLGTPVLAALGASPAAWWGLPLGMLTVAYALRMRRRTPEAAQEVQHWRTLQEQLKAGDVPGVHTIAQWERILLYAEAMGMGKEAAAAMQRSACAGLDDMPWPDAREATFLAWPLLAYTNQLPRWFELFCQTVAHKSPGHSPF